MTWAHLVSAKSAGHSGNGNVTANFDGTGCEFIAFGCGRTVQGGIGDCTSSTGDTYTLDENTNNDVDVTIYSKGTPTVTSSMTVSITPGASTTSVWILGFSGHNTKDQSSQHGINTTTGTSIQPGALTPSAANQLAITNLCTDGSPTGFSIDSSFTNPVGAHNPAVSGVNYGASGAYLINPALSSLNPTWSWTSSVVRSTCMVIYGQSGAAGEIKFRNSLKIPSTTTFKSRNGWTLAQIKTINTWTTGS